MNIPIRARRAAVTLAALAATAAVPATASAATIPTNPTRIAASAPMVDDVLISIGLKPASSVTTDFSGGWQSWLTPYTQGIQSLGIQSQPCGFNLEALAAAQPDLIVGTQLPPSLGTYPSASCVSSFQAIAPTIFLTETYPPLNGAGQATSIWQNWTMSVASQLGRKKQADEVFAHMARRAAVIRPQVSGKVFAYVQMGSASTFNSANQYFSEEQPFIEDLGMKPFDPSTITSSCTNDPSPVDFCTTTDVSDEDLPDLSSANGILVLSAVGGIALSNSDVSTLTTNPLWTALPAVKNHHVAIGADYGAGTPLATSDLYSAAESMYGIKEFYATVGGKAINASLTLSPSRKLCWAIDPSKGKPKDELTITAGTQQTTLAADPKYTANNGVSSQSTGCMTATKALAKSIESKPAHTWLKLGTTEGSLKAGVPSIIASA